MLISLKGRITDFSFDEETPAVDYSHIPKQTEYIGYIGLSNGSILIQNKFRTLLWNSDFNDPISMPDLNLPIGVNSDVTMATQNGVAYLAYYAQTFVFINQNWEEREKYPYKHRGSRGACSTFIPGRDCPFI